MAESYEGTLSRGQLGALRVDEDLWGEGAEPIVREFLQDRYDHISMPKLQLAEIQGRTGLWVLGWAHEGTRWPPLLELIFGEDYAEERLSISQTVVCPRCRVNRYTPYGNEPSELYPFPALSRVDNLHHICTPCGNDEAMRDFGGMPPIPPDEWPIYIRGAFGQGLA